ncbi:MAG: trans-sulfuration enzyme family protein, partial [Haliscomenobacter sp.]
MSEHFETQAIRGQMDRTEYAEHSAPIFMTSSFVFDSAEEMAATFSGETDSLIYSRYNNPNTDELVSKVCALEGAEDGVATSSGMAAVFSSMAALLRSGDHVLASRAVFGSTHQILTQILSKWGIAHTYVDPAAIDQWAQHIRPETRMLVLESPSNPGLDLIDLEKAGRLCQEHGIIFNIDNCFATPYLQRPMDWGADIVVHSSTKWMDGQGRALSGLI